MTHTDFSDEFGVNEKPGPPCAVQLALAQLKTDERKKLEWAISTPLPGKDGGWLVPASKIQDWCKERNTHLSDFSIRRHRRQRCSCA